jgi:quercetin dioxygenase-like cupin family protein
MQSPQRSDERLPQPSANAIDTPPPPRHLATPPPQRIDHTAIPIVTSPSELPTQHLVSARDGAEGLFVAQQWLQPGDRVLLHTHPVEEAITFLSGLGEATLGEETVPIGAGVSLYIPAGVVHGFHCTEGTLHVMVAFPVPEFAETTIVEPGCPGVG